MSDEQRFDTEDEAQDYADALNAERICVLSEADILAGRDEDCTTHDHEGGEYEIAYVNEGDGTGYWIVERSDA